MTVQQRRPEMPVDAATLAAQARQKCFQHCGEAVEVILSGHPAHKGYLSGYFSMLHDLNPRYQSAVIASRDIAVLVVGAADAGGALEALGDPSRIFRYGFFCFEHVAGSGAEGYDIAGFESFEAAVLAALREVAGEAARTIGVDRTGGDQLWTLVTQHLDHRLAVDISADIMRARRTKLPGEIHRLSVATQLVERGLLKVGNQLAPGMSERDMAAIISTEMILGSAIPRLVSVTSGPRSALADAHPSDRRVQRGDLVRIDAGCVFQGYTSDMARTYVLGEPDEEQAQCYRAIRAGIEYELHTIRAGIRVDQFFQETVRAVRENGIPTYRRQHVGHGIGLAGGYDFPVLNPATTDLLEAGMTLCVETPYYRIGWGGMMIEDTILVTETGHEPITTIPRDLIRVG